MKHFYNANSAVPVTRLAEKALGAPLSSPKNTFITLLLAFLLLFSQGSIAQSITSVSPQCAVAGKDITLTINGSGFSSPSGNPAYIVVNGSNDYIIPASVTSTTIVATIPGSRVNGNSLSVRVRQTRGSNIDLSNIYTIDVISLTVTPGQNCSPGPVTLTASGVPANGSYRWFNAVGVQLSNTGSSFTTPHLTETTTYYVSGVTSAGCVTDRIPVQAIIGNVLPTVTDNGRCAQGTVTLRAFGAPAGAEYRWYTSPTGGTYTTGAEFTTPFLTTTTTYYVSIGNAECESSRVAVRAKIGEINKPIVTSDGDCGNGNPTITLTASGATGNQIYRWYNVATGGSPIHTGATYSRQRNNNQGGNYYVAIYDSEGNCESERVHMFITNQAPGAPIAINGSRCGAGFVTLSASGAESWASYNWYAAQSGGTPIATGLTFTTPYMEAGTSRNYYVSTVNRATGCDGERVLVTATAIVTGSIQAAGEILEPSNLELHKEAIFRINTNITTSEIESYQWYYQEVGSANWVPSANTPELVFQSMPGNIDALRVDIKIREENYTCYANVLPADRIFRIDNQAIVPLPVELISFKAERHTRGVNLTWVTASELDNKGFEVQVSTDGKTFNSIGFVESKVGTTSIRQNYSFLDTKAVSGTRYYRLAQIDLDGTTTYSAIRAVALDGANGEIAAYPNPFEEVVTVRLNGVEARKVKVILTNAMGKVMLEQQEETAGNTVTVNTAGITTAGVYLLHVVDDGEKHTFKLMKR